eukprot:TRINITY_DN229_c0_g1_i6.p1 TRINITY_DN229_c0_g1~~TRINITY_DN229_c0_g1_i6.p1  ORF type:complete len:360 (+),score=87.06 TRINITY_DN229_c0_g1_i6:32-1081(+)
MSHRQTWISFCLLLLLSVVIGAFAEDDHDHDHAHEKDTHAAGEAEHITEAWVSALGAVAIGTIISIVGILSIPVNRTIDGNFDNIMHYFVALAAGTLIADAFLHLIPHAFEGASHDEKSALGTTMLCGALMLMLLEKLVLHYVGEPEFLGRNVDESEEGKIEKGKHVDHTGHSHSHSADGTHGLDAEGKILPMGWLNLTAETMHNFVDGLAIGAAFLVSQPLGWATFLAVALHEIPQEMGDFGVLIQAGFSVKKAVLLNLASASSAFIGAIVALSVGSSIAGFTRYVIALTAGNFLYVGLVSIMPLLQRKLPSPIVLKQMAAFGVGVTVMGLLTLLEAEGEGGHADHDH